jgi:hypothetical protein
VDCVDGTLYRLQLRQMAIAWSVWKSLPYAVSKLDLEILIPASRRTMTGLQATVDAVLGTEHVYHRPCLHENESSHESMAARRESA